MATKRFVIAGGSGFIGQALAEHLIADGSQVVSLSRRSAPETNAHRTVVWDGRSLGDWKNSLEGADGLINLTGRSVDCIKTPEHRDEILRSRVESTRVLGEAQCQIDDPPPVWVQMSTAHIYGDPPTLTCTESSATGCGFAPMVGHAWEQAFNASEVPNQRRVVLRTTFVLGRDRGHGGGALPRLAWLTRCGLGGRIGRGTQGFSWIHERDLNRILMASLHEDSWAGVINATAPNPLSQQEFMSALRATLHVPIGLPATGWMVRMGAHYLLRSDPELALYGRYVVSERLSELGFEFEFPQLEDALRDLLAR